MADASFPTTTPAVYVPVAGQSLAVAGHIDDLHEKDRKEIIALGTKVGTGSSAPARAKALVASGAGTSVWDTLARDNLLTNGDFRIWQRGTAAPTATDNAYGPDRWRLLLGAANAFTIDRETSDVPTVGGKSGCKLTVGSGNNNKGGIFQVMEGISVKHLRGKKVSLQVSLKATAALTNTRIAVLEWTSTEDSTTGDPISAWNSVGTNPTLAANWAYLNTPASLAVTTGHVIYRVENLTVGASANNLAVLIWSDATTTTTTTDILRIFDAQLEEGEVCTEVSRRSVGLELLLCQRFFIRIEDFGSSGARIIAWGTAITTTVARVYIMWPTTMRGTPTITYNGTKSQYAILNASGGFAGTVSNVATVTNSVHTANIEVTTSAGLTAGDSTALTGSGATTAIIEAAAEI